MRLRRAVFRGLIGVYRSSGLKEITIDFTRCKHKITLITGPNGAGKSTILNALNPLPDSQSVYLDNMSCFKEIEYIMNDGTVYQIHIDYPVNAFGERKTTKAFLRKCVDGVFIDLNQNGNVGSYKDAIYNEFKLDPNFVSLTKLSSEDRGLVDKTPAERKKYVANVVSSTEVYNNIYKTLNKRSSIFKSMMNSIVAKIDSIGNADNLSGALSNTDAKLKILEQQKDDLTKKLADAEAMIRLSDPNGTIRNEWIELQRQIASVQDRIQTLEMFINKNKDQDYYQYVDTCEKCSEYCNSLDSLLKEFNDKIEQKQKEIMDTLVSREEEAKALQLKQNRLKSLTSEYDYDTLLSEINKLKASIANNVAVLESVGLSEDTTITKEEFVSGINIIKTIREQISVIRSYAYEDQIQKAIEYIKTNFNIIAEREKIKQMTEELSDKLSKTNSDIMYYNNLKSLTDVLVNRPADCSIDNCSFIKNALEAQKQDPDNNLRILGEAEKELREKLFELEKADNNYFEISNIISDINVVVRSAQNSGSILNKIPYGEEFSNIDNLLEMISTGRQFSEFDKLYSFLDCVNVLEELRYNKDRLNKLETEFKIFESKNTLIEELNNDINSIISKLKTADDLITNNNEEIKLLQNQIKEAGSMFTIASSFRDKYLELAELEDLRKDLSDRVTVLEVNMSNIETAVKNANAIDSELKRVTDEIEPIIAQRDEIKYSLHKLDEYMSELEMYTQKFNVVELLKKYSSPTKDGIQNLFVEVYMGQTLSIANSLLKIMFDKLELMKYQINEKEFKIPCRSLESTIVNDDISSCSTSEKCMIGLSLSAALLKQASPIYDILELDETDGGLDQDNRANFPSFIDTAMDILGMSNCIMISHASESVLSNIDIICLGRVGNELPNGNIIFTYEDEQNKRVC